MQCNIDPQIFNCLLPTKNHSHDVKKKWIYICIFVALANTSCFLLMTGAEFIPLDGGCHTGLSDSVRSVWWHQWERTVSSECQRPVQHHPQDGVGGVSGLGGVCLCHWKWRLVTLHHHHPLPPPRFTKSLCICNEDLSGYKFKKDKSY